MDWRKGKREGTWGKLYIGSSEVERHRRGPMNALLLKCGQDIRSPQHPCLLERQNLKDLPETLEIQFGRQHILVESSSPHIQHFRGSYEKGELESAPMSPNQRVELVLKFIVQRTNPFFFAFVFFCFLFVCFCKKNQQWHMGSY